MTPRLSPDELWKAFMLWRNGHDTISIAAKLETTEAATWNSLTDIRKGPRIWKRGEVAK